jgi:hypothetical protein
MISSPACASNSSVRAASRTRQWLRSTTCEAFSSVPIGAPGRLEHVVASGTRRRDFDLIMNTCASSSGRSEADVL